LFQAGDILVCDASKKAVSCGETDPDTLLSLHKKGVNVYSCPALHAKCAVFDDYVLIGSSNMSESSSRILVEIAVLQEDVHLAREVESFLYKWIFDNEPLSEKEIKGLKKYWCKNQSPWQKTISRCRELDKVRGKAYHVETIDISNVNPPGVTNEEIEKSEHRARTVLKEVDVKKGKRELEYYWRMGTWSNRYPKDGDDIILVMRKHCKNGWRSSVCGPATVVSIDKVKKCHFVHYLRPKDQIPYSEFRTKFKGKSAMNRYGIKQETFEKMVCFISEKVSRK
jgi:hypothetical protein